MRLAILALALMLCRRHAASADDDYLAVLERDARSAWGYSGPVRLTLVPLSGGCDDGSFDSGFAARTEGYSIRINSKCPFSIGMHALWRVVIIHEMGHSIGVPHSRHKESIMFSIIDPRSIGKYRLLDSDIRAAGGMLNFYKN